MVPESESVTDEQLLAAALEACTPKAGEGWYSKVGLDGVTLDFYLGGVIVECVWREVVQVRGAGKKPSIDRIPLERWQRMVAQGELFRMQHFRTQRGRF